MNRNSVVVFALVLALVASFFQAIAAPDRAEAAVAARFDPGMIISDALFYDGSAMDAGAVQSFLNGQVSSCISGYTCLKDYSQDTPSRPEVAGRCAAYVGAAQESAATIIAKVGVACGISQKVLLVLLEKEQSLVTDTWPNAGQYRSATGYGCPDSAACDSTYYGYFNQVYTAALQFKRYAANPTGFNYIAGRYNNIQFNPNAGCGSAAVLIQNTATAGLYDYTPYQPNAAALANLYGVGDSCSAYGNRNFWRLYTDWFGSTSISSLARTANDAQVYLIVGDIKYRVPNMGILGALSPLGPLSIVSQSYLDSLTTGVQDAGRILRSPDGSIFFVDSSIKLPFTSCAAVADYGGSCNNTGFVNITTTQAALFHSGPPIMSVMGTREGTRYFISAGMKHEILDDASQVSAGLAFGYPILTEAALSAFPLAAPVVRDGVFVTPREGGNYTFLDGARRYAVSPGDAVVVGAAARSAGVLRADSIALIIPGATAFTGAFTAPGSTQVQVIVPEGRVSFTAPSLQGVQAVPFSAAAVALYPDAGTLPASTFVKTASDSTVYVSTALSIRPVVSWAALLRLSGTGGTRMYALPEAVVGQLSKGDSALGPGMLYRSTDNAQIYVVDGLTNLLYVTSFDNADAAGFDGLTFVSPAQLSGYRTSGAVLGFGLRCGTTDYVTAAGSLHALSATTAALYPIAMTTLDPATCAGMTVGPPAGEFIRVADGSIYKLEAGQKRYVSAVRFSAVYSGQGWLQVSDSFASLIPDGPAA